MLRSVDDGIGFSHAEVESEKWVEPLAVVGVHARVPGAETLNTFWKNLFFRKDSIGVVPDDRWDWRSHFGDAMEVNKTSVREAGFISNIDKFDARFFSISPREAKLMDPQQRLVLESVWHCIEDAGYRAADLAESNTGVFVAVSKSDYEELLYRQGIDIDANTGTGVAASIIANRISYVFDLRGPSMPIDTACSGSFMALHIAAQALRNNDCKMAIVAGVHVMLTPTLTISFDKAGMLSPDCRSKAFDASANGYARGEGVVSFLVKKLGDAERDRDQIYGLIKASAINHGGRSSSLTAPNAMAQKELIKSAIKRADVPPSTVTYIEAHGTGTQLGDPIEFDGIRLAYEELASSLPGVPSAPHSCAIGSVKANIGHLEAAAGLAGILKVLLAMRQGILPGNPHLREVNPFCKSDGSPFRFLKETEHWTQSRDSEGNAIPRRAGVSSFGFGGAYGHVILEEYIPAKQAGLDTAPSALVLPVLPLSAKNEETLLEYVREVLKFIQQQIDREKMKGASEDPSLLKTGTDIDDFLYLFQSGRMQFSCRVAVCGRTWEELERALIAVLSDGVVSGSIVKPNRRPIHESVDELDQLTAELASRWTENGDIEFRTFYEGGQRRRVSAPTYPFARTRFWFDSGAQGGDPTVEMVAMSEEKKRQTEVVQLRSETLVSLEKVEPEIAVVQLGAVQQQNMFSKGLIDGLKDCFERIEQDDAIRVVVVKSAVPSIFSMGGTPEWLVGIARGERAFTDEPFLSNGFLACKVPVITAMEGHAFGGGFLLGLYADLPILSAEAFYAANFMQYGLTPGMGGTLLLREKLGSSLATEMMWTARSYDGEELKQRGAGVLVLPREQVATRAMEIAKRIATMRGQSIKLLKSELATDIQSRLDSHVKREALLHRRLAEEMDLASQLEDIFRIPKSSRTVSGEGLIRERPGPADQLDAAITEKTQRQATERQESRVPRSDVKQELLEVIATALHLDPSDFGGDAALRDLGLDSISSIEISRAISRRLNIALTSEVIFKSTTISDLERVIRERWLDVFAEASAATDREAVQVLNSTVDEGEQTAARALGMLNEVCELVARTLHLETEECQPHIALRELGLDSVNAIDLLRSLEKKFCIKIAGDQREWLATCQAIADRISSISQNTSLGVQSAQGNRGLSEILSEVELGSATVEAALSELSELSVSRA